MRKIKLTPVQYQKLKKFFEFFSNRFFDLTAVSIEKQPITLLESMEKTAPSRAADGLLMAINDCIEMSSDWDPDKVSSLDAELTSNGIVTLVELRRQYSSQYARVIKRGKIKSVEEFYLLKGVLDGGSLEITPEEHAELSRIVESYESDATTR